MERNITLLKSAFLRLVSHPIWLLDLQVYISYNSKSGWPPKASFSMRITNKNPHLFLRQSGQRRSSTCLGTTTTTT